MWVTNVLINNYSDSWWMVCVCSILDIWGLIDVMTLAYIGHDS